ncbi:DUF2807 domain-containing protein [Flavobacterium arcticum]|uniref:DUF2807 domain-containing protein n=1 Tax=Flavobacterium arcticum TaxID=1784713 RepID=A0A345HAR0_9FLAO|nr:head GIN domain-containing protein [Flavobacterium arcticum]AXG73670.1 DUF2807 domain-containing protein [Flavobacterium arcticum]KAF2511620.1 DUF2807 domain-containing protein [Flavobacterium arcticum]
MKKVIVILFIIISQFANAQVTKNLGDFTTVKVFDQINVTLVKSDVNKIVIKGNRADEVTLVTKNDVLKIKMNFTKLLAGEDIEATLYYNGTIQAIEANEGSFVGSADTFKAIAFDVNAKEGATIKVILDVQSLESKTTSGGILELYGKCDYHDAKVNSGGILNGEELITKQTKISVSAGGEVEIYATDFVDAKVRAGGTIDVYGNPSQVNKKTFAGGDISIIQ